MTAVRDLRGNRFGRLTVVSRSSNTRAGKARWRCLCDCGTETVAAGNNLQMGVTTSCGCRRLELLRSKVVSHGDAPRAGKRTEYAIWRSMKARCANPKDRRFNDYGGRGIRVCDRWRNSYPAFLADVGRRPSSAHSIDRIDNNGHYEPGNVRWATPEQQAANKSRGPVRPLIEETESGAAA